MNEIPRRSFLAMLGAAVVAPSLPSSIAPAAPEIASEPFEPLTVLRRWWITDIVRHGNQSDRAFGRGFH
jgi:hypothetical protein